jgi:hypothetical protein
MPFQFTNNAATTLASGASAVDTTMTVASGQGALFPTPSGTSVFRATLVRASDSAIEIVEVTARSTDTMTVTRAQEGTTGLVFVTGDKFELRLTAAAMNALALKTGDDSALTRQMLIDCGMTVVDKGNSGTSTQTYDYTAGSVQTSTATGNHTIATSNWPPTGNLGNILIQLTNGGAYTITFPSWTWVKPDGTTTTSFSTYMAALTGRTALQSSGMDQIMLWSRDSGTTVYAKLI